jgi:choline dehydrogenase
MRAIYQRLENNQYVPNGTEGHGFSGWLATQQNDRSLYRPLTGFIEIVKNAFAAVTGTRPNSTEATIELMGRDMNRLDPARYAHDDIYQIPLHVDALRQRSSAQTYLRDTIEELNEDGTPRYPLTIRTNALATRVILENSNSTSGRPRAVGVEYLQGQALYRADRRNNGLQVGIPANVTATREVIVAGGAFNTPQILKLSGIGPREELESFNIPVVVDLPAVGENLQDNYEGGIHVQASVDFETAYENCTFLSPGDPCLRQWRDEHSGPYGQGAAPVGMLYRSSVSENEDADLFFFGSQAALFRGHFDGFSQVQVPRSTFFWSIVKMQMQNRAGTVRLRSADPQDTPIIDFNFFSQGGDHDLQALSEGIELAQRIFNVTGAPYGPFEQIEPAPGRDVRQALMDETFSHHASSSCAMGPANSTSTCVDSRFRVVGVDGLRVVDASVFPRVPGAFPILPTFMISEKALDVILEDN